MAIVCQQHCSPPLPRLQPYPFSHRSSCRMPPLIATKAKWRRCMYTTAVEVGKILLAEFVCCREHSWRRRLALVQVSSLTFSANRTGCQLASALCGPSIHRCYSVAKNRIYFASQPDSESTSTTASASTTRSPTRSSPHTALCPCAHVQAMRRADLLDGAVPC